MERELEEKNNSASGRLGRAWKSQISYTCKNARKIKNSSIAIVSQSLNHAIHFAANLIFSFTFCMPDTLWLRTDSPRNHISKTTHTFSHL